MTSSLWRCPPFIAVLLLAIGGCTVVGYPARGPQPSPRSGAIGAPNDPGAASVPADGGSARPGGRSPAGSPEVPRRSGVSYEQFGRTYFVMDSAEGFEETGLASWYGARFAGRPTANGEIFDPSLLTAAHRTLPLPSWVEVENLANGERVIVRVNDRGPFAEPEKRIIDLSRAAADRIGMIAAGVAEVRIRVVTGPGGRDGVTRIN